MSLVSLNGVAGKIVKDDETETIVMEIEKDMELPLYDGSKIKIPYINFKDNVAKNYIVIKSVSGLDSRDSIASIDFVYGNIDFSLLNLPNSEYHQKYFKYIFSREALDGVIRKSCGLLPEDILIPDNCEEGWIPSESDYIFNKEVLEAVFAGVLKASHREEIDDPREKEDNDLEEDISNESFSEMFRIARGGNIPKKEKKSAKQIFDEIDAENAEKVRKRKEERERRRKQRKGEIVEEPIDYAEEADLSKTEQEGQNKVLVVFYKTGIVITKIHLLEKDGTFKEKYATTVTPRYNFCFRNMTIDHKLTERESILIDGVEEEKIVLNSSYRIKLVNDIFVPLLECSKYDITEELNLGDDSNIWPYNGVFTEELSQKWPYIGVFDGDKKANEGSESSIKTNESLRKYFRKLGFSSQEQNRDD